MAIQASHNNSFVHPGIVRRIKDNAVLVRLDRDVHCESCRAKSACGMADSQVKEVEVHDPSGSFSLNEPVEVILRKGRGFRALLWAYIVPFALMTATLFTGNSYLPEWLAGLLALGILVPYYLIIRGFNSRFEEQFRVGIKKRGTL